MDSWSLIHFLMGLTVMAVCFGTAGLVVWLRSVFQRTHKVHAHREGSLPVPTGTVYDLKPGQRYRVRRRFDDYYGGRFEVEEILTFVKRDYLPYHGGHTLQFKEKAIYFQDEVNADILGGLWDYLELM